MIWLAVGILLLFRRRKEEMPLNIKNERVSHLATQVAAETGEPITDAVGVALEERLKSLRRQKQRKVGGSPHGARPAMRKPRPGSLADPQLR